MDILIVGFVYNIIIIWDSVHDWGLNSDIL
jgi:hypothetical protein